MTDVVLIFTFSPVQSFIAEARRAADLYVGSQILSCMARAAAQEIGSAHLIYPAGQDDRLPGDVPNVIVARVPSDKTREIAGRAHEALLMEWRRLAGTARDGLQKTGALHDQTWEDIWTRQINNLWQVFWAATPMEPGGYKQAYQTARDALDAVKRSRVFPPVEEPGAKDSLSGTREALHLHGQRAREYWAHAAKGATAARLRPQGQERLDAIGTIKRFCELAKKSSVSTSTIASADFRERAKQKAGNELANYRTIIEEGLGGFLYDPRKHDKQWPYDGDLLFSETLKTKRLENSYHGVKKPEQLTDATSSLRELYKVVGGRPSPYYAVIMLDGDNMGKQIACLLEGQNPDFGHQAFSRQLASFTQQVPEKLGRVFQEGVLGRAPGDADSYSEMGREFLIYNGGDDVLALAPLSAALPMAQALAQEFANIVPACSASAGLAIAHHLYPLDAALETAREAEKGAKQVNGKAAVSVRIIKRGGERMILRSKWNSMGNLFNELTEHFAEKRLSSRLAYDLSERAHIVTALSADVRKATIKQLVERHKNDRLTNPAGLIELLSHWAEALDGQVPPERVDDREIRQGFTEMARWVMLARFVAQGGGD